MKEGTLLHGKTYAVLEHAPHRDIDVLKKCLAGGWGQRTRSVAHPLNCQAKPAGKGNVLGNTILCQDCKDEEIYSPLVTLIHGRGVNGPKGAAVLVSPNALP